MHYQPLFCLTFDLSAECRKNENLLRELFVSCSWLLSSFINGIILPELRDEFLNKTCEGFLEEICFHIYLKRLDYVYIPLEGIYFLVPLLFGTP